MYLIVGLGNPGEEYENTRHNIGFQVVDGIAKSIGIGELRFKKKCNALVGEAEISGHKVIVCQPQTFMNLSGDSVQALLSWYKISHDHLIVCYDDVDIEPGEVKVRLGGSSAGHHGVESIMGRIGTPQFIRVRVGVGRETPSGDVSDHVLEKIPSAQKEILNEAILRAAEASIAIISDGLEKAKSRFGA